MAITLLNIPFNGSAIDTTPDPVTVTISGGSYGPGATAGQALRIADGGKAEIVGGVVPLSGTYTFACWLKAEPTADGPINSWVLVKFAGDTRFVYIDLVSPLTSWSYLVIQQGSSSISVSLNNTTVATEAFPSGWGKPTGFCVVNDSSAPSGNLSIQELTIWDDTVAATPVALPDPTLDLHYLINGVDFTRYGVYVSGSEGMLDIPALKEPFTANWADEHGEVIDLTAPRYMPRQITLSCFLVADSPEAFVSRLQAFGAQFTRAGLQRLLLTVVGGKPFVYDVYLRDGVSIRKNWSAGSMAGTFELKLIEPAPVKRVLWFGAGTVTLTLTTTKAISIAWGDGTRSTDVLGTNLTITHTYASGTDHYIVVSGVLDAISQFTTNATVVWSRL